MTSRLSPKERTNPICPLPSRQVSGAIDSTTSFDYIQSDDTHPTFVGATASTLFTTPTGSNPVFFATAGAYPDGKNPQWNRSGHERQGWSLSTYNPATP